MTTKSLRDVIGAPAYQILRDNGIHQWRTLYDLILSRGLKEADGTLVFADDGSALHDQYGRHRLGLKSWLLMLDFLRQEGYPFEDSVDVYGYRQIPREDALRSLRWYMETLAEFPKSAVFNFYGGDSFPVQRHGVYLIGSLANPTTPYVHWINLLFVVAAPGLDYAAFPRHLKPKSERDDAFRAIDNISSASRKSLSAIRKTLSPKLPKTQGNFHITFQDFIQSGTTYATDVRGQRGFELREVYPLDGRGLEWQTQLEKLEKGMVEFVAVSDDSIALPTYEAPTFYENPKIEELFLGSDAYCAVVEVGWANYQARGFSIAEGIAKRVAEILQGGYRQQCGKYIIETDGQMF